MAKPSAKHKLIFLLTDAFENDEVVYGLDESLKETLSSYELSERKKKVFYSWDVDKLYSEIVEEISELKYRGRILTLDASNSGQARLDLQDAVKTGLLVQLFGKALTDSRIQQILADADDRSVNHILDQWKISDKRKQALNDFYGGDSGELESIIWNELNFHKWDNWLRFYWSEPFPGIANEIWSNIHSSDSGWRMKYTAPAIEIASCNCWMEPMRFEADDLKKGGSVDPGIAVTRLDIFGSSFPPETFPYIEKHTGDSRQRIKVHSYNHSGSYRYSYIRAMVSADIWIDPGAGVEEKVFLCLMYPCQINATGILVHDESVIMDNWATDKFQNIRFQKQDQIPYIAWKKYNNQA